MKIQTKLGMISIPVMMSVVSVSSAATCAGPCNVTGDNPQLHLIDNVGANTSDWEIEVITESSINSRLQFGVNNVSNSFVIEDDAGNNTLVVDDVDRVGIKTATPAASLHVGGDGGVLLENGVNDYTLWSGATGLWVGTSNNTLDNNSMLKLNIGAPTNSLTLAAGGVGVGTGAPTSTLHVKKANAVLTVEDTNGASAVRQVLKLQNKGPVGFQMRDTDDTAPWDFRTGGGGSFVVANLGTAGPEIFVSKTGLVKMGPNVQNFTLSAAGNLTIPNGSVTATSFISSSSRTVKKDIKEVNASQVMSKLKQLEVPEWRYKDEGVKGRHIGPIAEDFYKLFELGPDDKHVAATDMASIALIAAKELQQKATQANTEIASFKEKIASFKEKNATLLKRLETQAKRLESLEKLVTNIASSEQVITQGEKLALNK